MSNADALAAYEQLPLPDTSEEHWRFTDLAGFDPGTFAVSDTGTVSDTETAAAPEPEPAAEAEPAAEEATEATAPAVATEETDQEESE